MCDAMDTDDKMFPRYFLKFVYFFLKIGRHNLILHLPLHTLQHTVLTYIVKYSGVLSINYVSI